MAINKKTLLEQAKILTDARVTNVRYSEEEIELALAWVSGEVTLTQVARVMSPTGKASGGYAFLACALRQWMNEVKK